MLDYKKLDNLEMIWVPDKTEGWLLCKIINSENCDEIEYEIQNQNKEELKRGKVLVSKTHCFDSTHLIDYDNICLMNNMHEAPLLDLLKRRFYKNHIYTYSGNVLISMNPYQNIAGLYDDHRKYIDLQNPLSKLYSKKDSNLKLY